MLRTVVYYHLMRKTGYRNFKKKHSPRRSLASKVKEEVIDITKELTSKIMNKNRILGIIRHILTFGGGFVVAKDWVSAGTLETVIGAIMTVVGVVWSASAPEKGDK